MVTFACMDEDWFDISVDDQGEELEFEARVLFAGYTHRVEVIVHDIPVLFEPDEELNYRAMVSLEQIDRRDNRLNVGLLQAIAHQLEALLNPKP